MGTSPAAVVVIAEAIVEYVAVSAAAVASCGGSHVRFASVGEVVSEQVSSVFLSIASGYENEASSHEGGLQILAKQKCDE